MACPKWAERRPECVSRAAHINPKIEPIGSHFEDVPGLCVDSVYPPSVRALPLLCLASLLFGCADSNQFTEGTVGVRRLESSALAFGSFRTDPADCESVRIGQCERVGPCRSRLAVVSAGTMTVERDGVEVATSNPNADGLYLQPIDEGGAPGDEWVVRFSGAEVEALTLSAAMPPPVGGLTVSRDTDVRLDWAPPAGLDSVLVEIGSPTDESIELRCELAGAATGVTVDAELLDGASNLTAEVTGYAEDRAGGVRLQVGEPARISVP